MIINFTLEERHLIESKRIESRYIFTGLTCPLALAMNDVSVKRDSMVAHDFVRFNGILYHTNHALETILREYDLQGRLALGALSFDLKLAYDLKHRYMFPKLFPRV